MRLKVLSDINSGQFKPGDEAEFSEDEALQLIDAGVAVEADTVATTTTDEAQVTEPTQEAKEQTAPLEVASASSSDVVQEQTPAQPTASQIEEDIKAAEGSSKESKVDVQIS